MFIFNTRYNINTINTSSFMVSGAQSDPHLYYYVDITKLTFIGSDSTIVFYILSIVYRSI